MDVSLKTQKKIILIVFLSIFLFLSLSWGKNAALVLDITADALDLTTTTSTTYTPSIGDHFVFNYTKNFESEVQILFEVFNGSDWLGMYKIVSSSNGTIYGLLDENITVIKDATTSNELSNATLSYYGNLTMEFTSVIQSYVYIPDPAPPGYSSGWNLLDKFVYEPSPTTSVVMGQQEVVFNDTYFFLGVVSQASIIVVDSPTYNLSHFEEFISDVAPENDTSSPDNSSLYLIPFTWTTYHAQNQQFTINDYPWELNTTTAEGILQFILNDTSPPVQRLQNALSSYIAIFNATNITLDASFGNFSLDLLINATYDSNTGHILNALQNITSMWDDLHVNGTGRYNGSLITFNAYQNSNTSCQVEVTLVSHDILYWPQSSTTTTTPSTTTTPTNETTTTTTTTTIPPQTSNTTTSNANQSTTTNETTTQSESANTTLPQIQPTPGFDKIMLSLSLLFTGALLIKGKRKKSRK